MHWDHPQFVAGRQFTELMIAGPTAIEIPRCHRIQASEDEYDERTRAKVQERLPECASETASTMAKLEFPRFMDLPLEIRDRIYSLALEIPEPSSCSMVSFKHKRWGLRSGRLHFRTWHVMGTALPKEWQEIKPPRLNILQTCKHVYAEAFHHFYSGQIIAFDDPKSLDGFLLAIGSKRRLQLTGIFFDWENCHAKEAFRLLRTCLNLTSVLFTIPCADADGLQALREVRGLQQAKVCAVKHLEAPGIAGDHRYWLVTDDHDCWVCRESSAKSLRNVANLERAMKRPRPKHWQGSQTNVLGVAAPKKRIKSEVENLKDDYKYFYVEHHCLTCAEYSNVEPSRDYYEFTKANGPTRTRRSWKRPYRFDLPPGRDLVIFDNGNA